MVGRGGSFSFSLFRQCSIRGRRTVPAVNRLRWTRIDFLDLFQSGFLVLFCLRCSLLRLRKLIQDVGLFLKFYEWPVVWVCVLLFEFGRFLFLFWILGSFFRMLGGRLRSGCIWLQCAGALILVVSLVAALCRRRYRFMAFFHNVSVSKTCPSAHWSFIIFENFRFCLFSRNFYEPRWFFFWKSVEVE